VINLDKNNNIILKN